jgi:subtilisin
MFRKRGSAQPRRRHTRRYAFFGLFLLALAAPIGWVAASVPAEPYVVLFTDDAVTVPDSAPSLTNSSLSYLLAANAQSQPVVAAAAGAGDGIGNRRVDPDRVALHIADLAARNGVNDIDDVYNAAVGGFSARLTAAQSVAIAADPSVAAVIPDEAISLDDVTAAGLGGTIRTTSNPTDHVQPGIRRVGARTQTVEALTAGGLKVDADVAILDTGIQRNHPDLNVVGGYNCTGRNRDKWDDDEGHGTHVAGIVGALDNRFGVTGVAPGVRLWSVKVLDSHGHGFVSWLVCGVDWVTAQRDKTNPSRPLIEVANMSLAFSGGDSANCGKNSNDTLHMAICRSVDRGTVYVVAAGNDSTNARRTRPAAYDQVITVSAMADYDGRGGGLGYPAESCPYWSPEPDDAFASFSNYGPDVDLIAPGKCVLSTYLNGRYAWMSGTSMATPHVTGAAVIYRTMFPKASPEQVQMALEAVGTYDWRTRTDPDKFHEPAVWIGSFRVLPDFSVTASDGTGVVAPGGTLPVAVGVTRVGGFNDAVAVSIANAPTGISATPIVTRGNNVTLTLRVADGTRPGRYPVTVQGAANATVHNQMIYVVVRGSSPQATFISPRKAVTVQSGTTVSVAWSEQTGGAAIASRRLDRQSGAIRTPGTCDGVAYTTEATRNVSTDTTDQVRSGYCYRWALTLTDMAGLRSTAYSGSVLVDSTAPRAPTVDVSGGAAYTPDLAALGVNQAYEIGSNTLWVRSGVSGSVPVQVGASDPQSGIVRNEASVSGSGWQTSWLGDSASGAMRLYYGAQSTSARLAVSSVNGAGLTGPSSTIDLLRDGSAPSSVAWVSAPSNTTRNIRGSYFRLIWSAATDTGSGLAGQQIVARYVAPLNPDGTCRTGSFTADGGFRLATDNSWDSGLQVNSCYVWSVRTLDNVGNTSASIVSGYVITRPTH